MFYIISALLALTNAENGEGVCQGWMVEGSCVMLGLYKMQKLDFIERPTHQVREKFDNDLNDVCMGLMMDGKYTVSGYSHGGMMAANMVIMDRG